MAGGKLNPGQGRGGVEVAVARDNVPVAVHEEDHQAGMALSLVNLAAHAE